MCVVVLCIQIRTWQPPFRNGRKHFRDINTAYISPHCTSFVNTSQVHQADFRGGHFSGQDSAHKHTLCQKRQSSPMAQCTSALGHDQHPWRAMTRRVQPAHSHPVLKFPHVEATNRGYEDGGHHQSKQPQTQTEPNCPSQPEECEACSEAFNPAPKDAL